MIKVPFGLQTGDSSVSVSFSPASTTGSFVLSLEQEGLGELWQISGQSGFLYSQNDFVIGSYHANQPINVVVNNFPDSGYSNIYVNGDIADSYAQCSGLNANRITYSTTFFPTGGFGASIKGTRVPIPGSRNLSCLMILGPSGKDNSLTGLFKGTQYKLTTSTGYSGNPDPSQLATLNSYDQIVIAPHANVQSMGTGWNAVRSPILSYHLQTATKWGLFSGQQVVVTVPDSQAWVLSSSFSKTGGESLTGSILTSRIVGDFSGFSGLATIALIPPDTFGQIKFMPIYTGASSRYNTFMTINNNAAPYTGFNLGVKCEAGFSGVSGSAQGDRYFFNLPRYTGDYSEVLSTQEKILLSNVFNYYLLD